MIVFDLVESYLSKGISVIIDTSCYLETTLEKGLDLSRKYKANYKYIECKVDNYEDIEKRIKARNHLESQLREPSIEKYKSLKDKSIKPKNINILVVNTTSKETYNIETILDYLYNKS